ncbi:MAG: hypothetical protein AB7S38_34900 [Vulcanimicrobiota bacterium]
MNVLNNHPPSRLRIGPEIGRPRLDIELYEADPSHLDIVLSSERGDSAWNDRLKALSGQSREFICRSLGDQAAADQATGTAMRLGGMALTLAGAAAAVFGPEWASTPALIGGVGGGVALSLASLVPTVRGHEAEQITFGLESASDEVAFRRDYANFERSLPIRVVYD